MLTPATSPEVVLACDGKGACWELHVAEVPQVEDAHAVTGDLEAIFDHLLGAYLDFGEPLDPAFDRARARVLQIE